jgi:hypothetical protein
MIKLIFLFLAIWFTLINTIRVVGGGSVPAINILINAIGITGFVWLQWF